MARANSSIDAFVDHRYEQFRTSADQHDDHKQTLMELAIAADDIDNLVTAIYLALENLPEDSETAVVLTKALRAMEG